MITASGQFFNSFRLYDKPLVEEKREACGCGHTSSTEWRQLRLMLVVHMEQLITYHPIHFCGSMRFSCAGTCESSMRQGVTLDALFEI